jgi:AcrR family transcriptional regulator
MPRSPEPTRSNLLDAASRLFAERGVYNVSLAEIVREANQKNVSALHYHFGGREELLEAVLARHIHPIGKRRLELVESARSTPPDDLRAPVAALVLPVTELAQQGQQQLEYLHIGVELATGPERNLPGLVTLFHETNGALVRDLLQERLPEIPERFLVERFHIASMLTGRAASDRARMLEADPGASLTDDEFTSNLIDMIVGAISSPLGTKGRSI